MSTASGAKREPRSPTCCVLTRRSFLHDSSKPVCCGAIVINLDHRYKTVNFIRRDRVGTKRALPSFLSPSAQLASWWACHNKPPPPSPTFAPTIPPLGLHCCIHETSSLEPRRWPNQPYGEISSNQARLPVTTPPPLPRAHRTPRTISQPGLTSLSHGWDCEEDTTIFWRPDPIITYLAFLALLSCPLSGQQLPRQELSLDATVTGSTDHNSSIAKTLQVVLATPLVSFPPPSPPAAVGKMHPPSFRQLVVASTILVFCLFLYGKRLWAPSRTEIHDEWAKTQFPQQPQQPAQPPAQQQPVAEEKPAEPQPALQQVPWHWNAYPA